MCFVWHFFQFQPPERKTFHFKPFVIPRELQKNLPYKDKPKVKSMTEGGNALERVAVVLEEAEKEVKLHLSCAIFKFMR